MKVGDYVWISNAGDIELIDREEHDRRQNDGGRGTKFFGVVTDVREPEDDTVVELQPSEPNVEGVFITLGHLKKQFGA